MTQKTLVAAIGAALSLLAAPAGAADLLSAPPPRIVPAPIEVGGGWYLRGDVGVGVQTYDSVTLTVPGQPGAFAGFRRETEYFDDPTIIGAGLGYQFNEWFRMDATLEYRSASRFGFTLVDRTVNPLNPFANVFTGQVSSITGMVNAYADIGNFWGIIPFVGAGIGFANHRVEGFTDTGVAGSAGGYGIAASSDNTEFAWAIHAGLGYAVSDTLKLELSYRYLNMGDLTLGTINCFNPCQNPQYEAQTISSHDFRVGMRWMLNPPPPLVRPVVARN